MKRLRAIREYTSQTLCNHNPPHKTTAYIVTFVKEGGCVVADASFHLKEEADFIVDVVNEAYNKLGEPIEHGSKW